jgi:hypothetical protein
VFNDDTNELKVYSKINIYGYTFNTKYNSAKHDDSCYFFNDEIGIINWILKRDDEIFWIFKKIVVIHNPYYCPAFPKIKTSLSVGHITDELIVHKLMNRPNTIEKICLFSFSKNECFISTYNSGHLFV